MVYFGIFLNNPNLFQKEISKNKHKFNLSVEEDRRAPQLERNDKNCYLNSCQFKLTTIQTIQTIQIDNYLNSCQSTFQLVAEKYERWRGETNRVLIISVSDMATPQKYPNIISPKVQTKSNNN